MITTPIAAPYAMPLRQQFVLVWLGIGFWFFAAMLVRFAGTWLLGSGDAMLAAAFLLTLPLSYGFIVVAKATTGLHRGQYVRAVTIMTGIAAVLDGIALTWFPSLYHHDPEIVKQGGFLILEGAGVGLLLGHLLSLRAAEARA